VELLGGENRLEVDASSTIKRNNKLYRLWFYLRTGLSNYIGLPISAFNIIFLVYLTLISINPSISKYMPIFVLTITVIILFLGILLGLVHFKKTLAFSAEIDILIESNPWYYKVTPGINKEIMLPYLIHALKGLKRLSDVSSKLTKDESELINFLLNEGNDLLKGKVIKDPFIKDKRKILMDKIQASFKSSLID